MILQFQVLKLETKNISKKINIFLSDKPDVDNHNHEILSTLSLFRCQVIHMSRVFRKGLRRNEGPRELARSVNFDNTRNIVYGMLEVIAMEKY